ncbi:hypothetical protein [Amorphus orientalis]|uniref:Small lipoprotein YifL n=1 Tax=Amorphus orientalis TaxID=649198 RepID=A0AAE3VS25_9HYPH|nr:hypothetical protein [Amorphus orientalis]MDQ0317101.1 putative small lipoprotein YifL [Amorphus orientalis]
MVEFKRRTVVGVGIALCLAVGLSACGRKAGPYAPPPPTAAENPDQPYKEPWGQGSTRKFILDPIVTDPLL